MTWATRTSAASATRKPTVWTIRATAGQPKSKLNSGSMHGTLARPLEKGCPWLDFGWCARHARGRAREISYANEDPAHLADPVADLGRHRGHDLGCELRSEGREENGGEGDDTAAAAAARTAALQAQAHAPDALRADGNGKQQVRPNHRHRQRGRRERGNLQLQEHARPAVHLAAASGQLLQARERRQQQVPRLGSDVTRHGPQSGAAD